MVLKNRNYRDDQEFLVNIGGLCEWQININSRTIISRTNAVKLRQETGRVFRKSANTQTVRNILREYNLHDLLSTRKPRKRKPIS